MGDGNCLFLDVGFSANKSSSGLDPRNWLAERLRIMAHEIVVGEPIPVLHQVVYNRDYLARLRAAVPGTSQSAADHLHVTHRAEYRARYDNRRGLWRIKAGREHLVVGENFDAALKESLDGVKGLSPR